MRDLTYSSEPEPVSEPHFEAEWTLRSAQPVVPLAAVEQLAKRRQWLLLILALICAILVGALSASLFYSKQSNASLADSHPKSPVAQVDNSRVEEIKNESVATQSADDLELNDEDQVVTDGTELGDSENSEQTETAARRSTKNPKSPKRVSPEKSQSLTKLKVETDQVVVPQPTSDVMPDNDPQTGEERRPRRVKRDAQSDQRRDVQPRDDLFRIRDIFEGPRRRRF